MHFRFKYAKKCAEQWGERARIAAYERFEVITKLAFETEYTKIFGVSPGEETDGDIRKKRFAEVFVETGIHWPVE